MIKILLGFVSIFIVFFIIFNKKTFTSFLYRTILSVLMVAVYVVYSAPDVALAEAMLGALLTTFVYLLVFKIHSKIVVAVKEIPVICEEHQGIFIGVIPTILSEFSKKYNHKIEFLKVNSFNEINNLIKNGKADIGISYNGTFKILDIPIFETNNKEYSYFELIKQPQLKNVKKIKNLTIYFNFSDNDTIIFEEFSEFYNQKYVNSILKKYNLQGGETDGLFR